MSKWLQHTIELIIACLILIGVAVFFNTHQIKRGGHETTYHHFGTAREIANRESTPTLYFHGLQGSAKSTNHLINVGAKTDGRKVMTINVERNGQIKYQGSLNNQMHNPLVQVNFLDNVAPVKNQVKWTHQILLHLKARNHCSGYNAVAHSAGAVTVLETADQFGNRSNVPKLYRFVSIGGPYDGVIGINDRINQNYLGPAGKPELERPANRWYPSYAQLVRDSRHFPKKARVLNVYGCINPRLNSDQYVSTVSARSLRYLLRNRCSDYQEIRITGRYAQHSLLHHNSVVDRVIDRFIFTE